MWRCAIQLISALVLLVLAGVTTQAAATELLLQTDPVHLGDTPNSEWLACDPPVPASPADTCYVMAFELTEGQANCFNLLTVESSGASADTTARVFLDGDFLGFLAEAVIGGRCDFHESTFSIALGAGVHEVVICSSLFEYQTGFEFDDFAFRNAYLRSDQPSDSPAASWGAIKAEYRR